MQVENINTQAPSGKKSLLQRVSVGTHHWANLSEKHDYSDGTMKKRCPELVSTQNGWNLLFEILLLSGQHSNKLQDLRKTTFYKKTWNCYVFFQKRFFFCEIAARDFILNIPDTFYSSLSSGRVHCNNRKIYVLLIMSFNLGPPLRANFYLQCQRFFVCFGLSEARLLCVPISKTFVRAIFGICFFSVGPRNSTKYR